MIVMLSFLSINYIVFQFRSIFIVINSDATAVRVFQVFKVRKLF